MTFAAAVALTLAASPQGFAVNYGVKNAILVDLSYQIDPAEISLSWPLRTDLVSYTITRTDPGGGNLTVELSADSTGYTDTTVTAAIPYEYQISAKFVGSTAKAKCFIAAGIGLPLVEERGVVLLMIDSTIAAPLASEIERFQRDLNGDGWRFETHLIDPATSSPPAIRNLIIARHAADTEINSVLLLGKIPVPYSGNHSPDGHSPHRGAWPADAYYGELDGNWTDSSVTSTSAARSANHNIPGDGKFDQTMLPSDVDLAVGRIDLSNLPSYAPLTEIDLLRRYFDKNHTYRQASASAGSCAVIDDHLSNYSEGFAAPPRAAFTSILGASEVQDGDWHTVAGQSPQLFGAGIGFANYTSISGVTSTTQTVSMAPSVTFSLLFGSYFGDWDNSDNVLRAQLGTPSGGLATMYSGRPIWQLHPLGHGKTLGDITRLTLNAQYLAPYPTGYAAYRTHITLMGDPTLRLFPAAPPATSVAVLQPSGAAAVHWSPPATTADGFIGYQVYRCTTANTPPQCLTSTPITDLHFTDPAPLLAGSSYLVKTIALQQTASSSFHTASQASFATLAPAISYAEWSTQHFAAPAPELGDPDSDTLPNLLEYAIGTDPTVASTDAGLSIAGTTADKLNFCYAIAPHSTGANVAPQVSSDLTNWQAIDQSVTLQVVPHPTSESLQLIKFSIDRPAAGQRLFIRLSATASS